MTVAAIDGVHHQRIRLRFGSSGIESSAGGALPAAHLLLRRIHQSGGGAGQRHRPSDHQRREADAPESGRTVAAATLCQGMITTAIFFLTLF